MSTNKLSLQELADELSAKSNITKRAAEDFVRVLFSTIEEALSDKDSVKIKDFGTFKVQSVEARKSVNVQTGEEIIIPEYNKISFIPDQGFKALVNEPFAHLEAVVLDNLEETTPLRNLSEQANEIKSIISDIEALSPKKEQKKDNEPIIEKQAIIEDNDDKALVEDEVIDNEVVIDEESEKEETEETTTEDTKEEYAITEEYIDKIIATRKRKIRTWCIVALSTLLLCIGIYFVFKNPFVTQKLASWTKESSYVEFTVITDSVKSEKPSIKSDSLRNTETIQPKTTEEVKPVIEVDELQKVLDSPRVYNEFITTEKMKVGGRLARFALDYYGHPRFWVYIYEANKDVISDPNSIAPGTSIRIPKLNPLLIKASDPRCIQKADELEALYLEKDK